MEQRKGYRAGRPSYLRERAPSCTETRSDLLEHPGPSTLSGIGARVAAGAAGREIRPHRSPIGLTAQTVSRSRFRSATTARTSSQSTSLKLCIGQYFGPHIEQNSAVLK